MEKLRQQEATNSTKRHTAKGKRNGANKHPANIRNSREIWCYNAKPHALHFGPWV